MLAQNAKSSNREYSLLVAWEQFRLGFDFFTAGHDLSACQSIQQRRGWWSALEASADCETYDYLHGSRK